MRFGDVLGGMEGPIVDDVVETGVVNAAKNVVERVIFQNDPHDVLDLALQVRYRCWCSGLVAKWCTAVGTLLGALRDGNGGVASGRLVGAHRDRCTKGSAREAQ